MENKLKTIRLCNANEVNKLQEYIKTNWQENHIFVHSRELLLWQHDNSADGNLNYVIALNENEDIVGVLGFIPTFKYDTALSSSETSIWLALWKANEEYPGTGFYMLRFIEEEFTPNSIAAIGINDDVQRLYKALGYKFGTWSQYYYLNSSNTDFKMIQLSGNQKNFEPAVSSQMSEIKEIESLSDLADAPEAIYSPLKSIDYFINRFTNHPFYKYIFFGVYTSDQLVCLFVMRKIETEGSACLRIVDVLGDLNKVENLSAQLDKVLKDENAEYVDFVNFGIDEEIFYKIGFRKREEGMIIPNYFEPFLRQNVDVKSAYKTDGENYVIFKADGDQDRPSLLQKA